jgi:hypothetical protein
MDREGSLPKMSELSLKVIRDLSAHDCAWRVFPLRNRDTLYEYFVPERTAIQARGSARVPHRYPVFSLFSGRRLAPSLLIQIGDGQKKLQQARAQIFGQILALVADSFHDEVNLVEHPAARARAGDFALFQRLREIVQFEVSVYDIGIEGYSVPIQLCRMVGHRSRQLKINIGGCHGVHLDPGCETTAKVYDASRLPTRQSPHPPCLPPPGMLAAAEQR